MIGLVELKSLNDRASVQVNTPWNRDCSACASRSGFVIHSAAQRSAAFISKEEHPESYQALQAVIAWRDQAALNAWIESCMADCSTLHSNCAALVAAHKRIHGLKISAVECGPQGGGVNYVASIKHVPKCELRLGGASLTEMHARLCKVCPPEPTPCQEAQRNARAMGAAIYGKRNRLRGSSRNTLPINQWLVKYW